MAHPCVRVDAMVVSEIIDKLSPNMMPPIMHPIMRGKGIPAFSATPMAIGPTAAALPTDVPVAVAIKPEMTKTPAAKYSGRI